MSSSIPEEDKNVERGPETSIETFMSQFYPAQYKPRFPRSAKNAAFPHALEEDAYIPGVPYSYAHRRPLTTLREFNMMAAMDDITDKPNWDAKVFDDEITAKWREEATGDEDFDVSEKMMDYAFEELKCKAKLFKKTGAVTSYDGDVVKSDTAVPESLKLALRKTVVPLENVPDDQKDWHPGSNGLLLDLVHPSLFPLVTGVSRVVIDETLGVDEGIAKAGKGETVPGNFDYQWLPCEVKFRPANDGSGNTRCKIASYINNLHPHDHRQLYGVIEEILACAIPLWNMSLTPLDGQELKTRISYDSVEYDPDPEEAADELGPKRPEIDDDDSDADGKIREWEDAVWAWKQEIWDDPDHLLQPEPDQFDKTEKDFEPRVDLAKEFAEQGLQVIVKLANIHLTPDKPEYPGGSWHVEGTLRERICATALYYYDSSNITTSSLSFRCICDPDKAQEEISYEQNHHSWLEGIFGLENDGPNVQYVGNVHCNEGRLLTFPNIFQHRVQPFQLADPTQPGHRKILALFLVDPTHRVLSTANVPAQREDWFQRQIDIDREVLGKLPLELRMMVREQHAGSGYPRRFPIPMEDAKRHREMLMEERKDYVSASEENWVEYRFSLCEH